MDTDDVTRTMESPENPTDKGPLSLSFDPATLTQGIRVKPAQFARMCNVSRQTVSRWVKRGLVHLYPDGLLDPAASSRRVIEKTDPARLRARIFKDALKGLDEWKAEAKALASDLAAAEKKTEYLDSICSQSDKASDLYQSEVSRLLVALVPGRQEEIKCLLNELADTCCLLADEDNTGMDLDSIHLGLVALFGNGEGHGSSKPPTGAQRLPP